MSALAVRSIVVSRSSQVPESVNPLVPQQLEIRMLGPFQVRRGDGGAVERSEWRTGKAADLLRLLALRAGDPVSATALVMSLWPGSDQRRGQASLRTAASAVRRVVGPQFLERSLAGLRLVDAWVDVTAFRDLAARAHDLTATGDFAAAHGLAREADRLFRGDFTAHDDGADWAQNERRALSNRYQVLLCDAAEAAAALGLGHEAVDCAGRAIRLDPFSERASRLLMRSHADVGELSQALREYERCRTLLSEELGIDPSAQTREVHLALLRSQPVGQGRPAPPTRPSWVTVDSVENPTPATDATVDPCTQAEHRLQLAMQDYIPRRQFVRARRCADEAAALSDQPGVRARASIAYWLPDVLLGGGRVAREQLAQAERLAQTAGDRTLIRRLEILNCLIAHDVGAIDFPARWARATAPGEIDDDSNLWLLMRIANERGDVTWSDATIGNLAKRFPVTSGSGPLHRHLHQLAAASALAASGETGKALLCLQTLAATLQHTDFPLLLPETLARLIALQADTDVVAGEQNLVRLDRVLHGQRGFPREAYLRLIAVAALHFARGRPAGAAAAAAQAAEVAETHGLAALTVDALELCARYTAVGLQATSARRDGRATLTLSRPGVAI